MKRFKNLSLAAIMALGMTALVGVTSASASESALETNETYPRTITGTGILSETGQQHKLKTNYNGERYCSTGPAFSATLNGATTELTATPEDGKCYFGALGWKTLKMNGCKLTFNFAAKRPDGTFSGTVDIGPSGCGPIKLEHSCAVSIPAQDGLWTSYKNIGSGKTASVRVTANIVGMTYTLSGSCGGEGGTYHNGEYSGSWEMTANSAGIFLVGPAPTGFEAEQYPASLAGAQKFSEPQVFKFPTNEMSVQCETATFAGELAAQATTISLSPTYSGCKSSNPVFNGTIKPNGCVYTVHSNTNSLDITCPEGKSIEFLFGSCKVLLPAQKGVTSIYDGLFTTSAGQYGVTLDWSITNLYHQQIDAFLCPFQGNSEHSNGQVDGVATVEATNSDGEAIGIWTN